MGMHLESCPLRAAWRRRNPGPCPSNCRLPVQAAASPSATSTSPMSPWWTFSTCPSSAPMGISCLKRSWPCSQRRRVFPAFCVGAPKTHLPGWRYRLAASAGEQSAAGALDGRGGTEGSNAGHTPPAVSPGAASADPDLVSGSSPTCRPTPLASAGHSHDSCLDAPLSSDAALSGHVLRASGFVPYYRTPEEELHSSPGPPASSSGGQEPTGELPRPGAATL
uniref:Uncharacterized protein n=1 Tax=Rousettus aegyptiacus TaxID=9407 RepID=A0A7J8FJL0_ROUAE|nr:hypothetical protein HJG63_012137 [Rousettus aegyptiacus]